MILGPLYWEEYELISRNPNAKIYKTVGLIMLIVLIGCETMSFILREENKYHETWI